MKSDLENLLLQAAGRTGGSSSVQSHGRRRQSSYSDGSSDSDPEPDNSRYNKKKPPSGSQVPLKQRHQPERGGQSREYSDEESDGGDSDSAPSVGSDLYKDEDDKEQLEKRSELDREIILAERSRYRDDYHLKKMAMARAQGDKGERGGGGGRSGARQQWGYSESAPSVGSDLYKDEDDKEQLEKRSELDREIILAERSRYRDDYHLKKMAMARAQGGKGERGGGGGRSGARQQWGYSDSAPSVGSDLYKDEDDKEQLEKRSELDREIILAERSRYRDDYHLKKMAMARAQGGKGERGGGSGRSGARQQWGYSDSAPSVGLDLYKDKDDKEKLEKRSELDREIILAERRRCRDDYHLKKMAMARAQGGKGERGGGGGRSGARQQWGYSDSAPSVGSDLYKDEDDKEQLEKRSELDREIILAERSRYRDDYHLKKMAMARAQGGKGERGGGGGRSGARQQWGYSDSAPSVGSDLYKDEDDKEQLEKRSELDREIILAERRRCRDDYHLKKMAMARVQGGKGERGGGGGRSGARRQWGDSDSVPSVGSDLYKDKDDKEQLEKRSELEREMILAERSRCRDDYRLKKMAMARAQGGKGERGGGGGSSGARGQRDSSPPPPATAMAGRGSAGRMSVMGAEKSAAARSALDELLARRKRKQDSEGYRNCLKNLTVDSLANRDRSPPLLRRRAGTPPSDGGKGDSEDQKDDELAEDSPSRTVQPIKFEDIKDITIPRSREGNT